MQQIDRHEVARRHRRNFRRRLSNDDRAQKAARLAGIVRTLGTYRWVGVYDVGPEVVSIIAWNGPGAPAHPSFPVIKGITGVAIAGKKSVVVDDVRTDPHYLTAFGSTVSEIIVPVLHPRNGNVIGTIDVESERADRFTDEDRETLEQCAVAALPLWVTP